MSGGNDVKGWDWISSGKNLFGSAKKMDGTFDRISHDGAKGNKDHEW
jgi:hypothetical protein